MGFSTVTELQMYVSPGMFQYSLDYDRMNVIESAWRDHIPGITIDIIYYNWAQMLTLNLKVYRMMNSNYNANENLV